MRTVPNALPPPYNLFLTFKYMKTDLRETPVGGDAAISNKGQKLGQAHQPARLLLRFRALVLCAIVPVNRAQRLEIIIQHAVDTFFYGFNGDLVGTVRAVVVVVGVVGAVVVVALLSESLSCPLAGADL